MFQENIFLYSAISTNYLTFESIFHLFKKSTMSFTGFFDGFIVVFVAQRSIKGFEQFPLFVVEIPGDHDANLDAMIAAAFAARERAASGESPSSVPRRK